ncbi:MAG TPA: sugar phosphate isomerase/epimerase [Chitinophagaceae bacterium]|nr:sugar phosphate isomerase/epimerase [Chitinophagaceae bacterium]
MTTSRRTFIKNSTLAIAGTAVLPDMLKFKSPASTILGLQLYTVRDHMQKDPEGTLKKLAAMGFKHVEHAGYHDRKFYGYTPGDFKKLLSDIGLQMASGHTPLTGRAWDKNANDFTDQWKHTIDDAAAVGLKYMISPGVDESFCKNMDDFKMYMDLHNKTGELCKRAGIHFAFHNESYEFNHSLEGTQLYELLLKLCDKNLVAQQIDIGNMYEPGGRAMYYLKKYPGRFMLMHVKDEIKRDTAGQFGNMYESCELDKGIIGVKEIVDYARKTGTKYFIIEQEDYQGVDPLDSSKYDLQVMNKWGF